MSVTLCNDPIYQIIKDKMSCKPLVVDEDVWAWLERQAAAYKLNQGLGHTLDGIFWGQFDGKQLNIALTGGGAFIEFDRDSFFDLLCELRLFGETAELHLWQHGATWRASLIQDGTGDASEYTDDEQLVWGTHIEATNGAFTLVGDGVQGLYHGVPLPSADIPVAEDGKHRPLRLKVRHYLADDEMGCVHVAFSRLVEITAVAEEVPS